MKKKALAFAAMACSVAMLLSACGGSNSNAASGDTAGSNIITAYNSEPQNPLIPGNTNETGGGKPVDLPPKELELLYFLASSPNQVFTREQLLDHIWGYEYIGDTRTVDVHIKRLREKIKDHPNWSISTVWGIGYKFEVKSE